MEVLVDEACERSLEERIAHVCGHLNVLHAELVDMVCEAAETGAWEVFGIKSLAQWVAWQTGLSPAWARQIVTIAERRGELPVSFDAFAQGRVAIDQMVTVAAKVPAPFDAQAAELAQVCTVTQLGRAFNKHAFPEPVIDPASPVTPVAERDYVSYHADDHGRFRLTLACDALRGATILAAIDEARDALFTAGNTDVTLIDTIVEIAQRSLATIDSVSRADRYRVLVHLDTDGLFLHQGPRLPTALHDSLLCDGVLQPVWETSGTPINVGRNHRTVPERLRRLIEHRDQHCQHPTCTSTHHLDIHHMGLPRVWLTVFV